MKVAKTLRFGRVFEKELFGRTDEDDFVSLDNKPERLSYDASIIDVIEKIWKEYDYDPTDPRVGNTNLLFQAVKKHLPRRVRGRHSHLLNLYISVGRTSLDWYYGVDAFFVWEGALVTFDASTRHKEKGDLKADLLFTPEDLFGERLEYFGRVAARLLKTRRRRLV